MSAGASCVPKDTSQGEERSGEMSCEDIPRTRVGADGRGWEFRGDFDEYGRPEYVRDFSPEERRRRLRSIAATWRKGRAVSFRGTARGREARTCAVRSGGRLVSATVSTSTGTDSGDSPPSPPGPSEGDDEGSRRAGLGPALTHAGQVPATSAARVGAFS